MRTPSHLPPRHRPISRLILLGCAAALAVSACSTSGSSSDEPLVAGDPSPATTTSSTAHSTTPATDSVAVPDGLAGELDAIREETGVPAFGVSVLSGSETLDAAISGVRQLGDDTPAAIEDTFHLGSNTKAMTAALVARLSDDASGIGFDTTLAQAFPHIETMDPAYASVTLADLLAHIGGTPVEVGDVDDSFFDLTVTEQRALAAEMTLTEAPETEPRTIGRYSNIGYVVVAAALEAATGESWEHLMQVELFDPLAMESCGFGTPSIPDSNAQPFGHDPQGEPTLDDNPPVLNPAGGVHCSMADWGRFLAEILNGLNARGSWLNAEPLAQMMTPIEGMTIEGFEGTEPALGWITMEGPDGMAYWHNGSNTYWYSEAVIVPGIDRIVLAVSNQESTGSAAAQAAMVAASRMYP